MNQDSTHTTHTEEHATDSSTAQHGHGGAAAAHGEHANPVGGEVFTHLLNQLGDHHELNIFFNSYEILPVILMDDGLHFYANPHAMEEAGMFTMHHPDAPHRIVSTTKKDAKGKPASPSLDLSVTNFVAYQWIAIVVVTLLFAAIRGQYRKGSVKAPKGLANVVESVVVYVRDEMVVPNVGTVRRATAWMPYFMSLFFFIVTLNLVGLLPGAHVATGSLAVTAALALTSFLVVNFVAIKDAGIKAWLHHLLGGAPWYMAPIMVPIEIVSLFTKPFALTIRLFANMTAGHVVLLSLVGLIFFFQNYLVIPVSVSFSVFIYLLELLVAFLQAYIFTMLSAVFVGLALGDHAAHDHHHDHAEAH